jgi:hypothetical protein
MSAAAPLPGCCLFYVEDPGGANYIVPLVQRLMQRGANVKLAAGGFALALVRGRGLEPIPVASADELLACFDALHPDIVVAGTAENPDSPGLQLIQRARAREVITVGVVDHGANSAHRFRGRSDDPFAHVPLWLVVVDEWTAHEFQQLGFARDRIMVTGHPHFDSLLAVRAALLREGRGAVRRRVFPGVAPESLLLLFVSEISDGLNASQYQRSADYTLLGRGAAQLRTEIVCQEFLDAVEALRLDPAPVLILRRHPKEPADHLAELVGEFDRISQAERAAEAVFAADVVVGMTSVLLEEAGFMQTRVLSVVPRVLERDWLAGTRSGAIPCVTSRDALRRNLADLVNAVHRRTPPQQQSELAAGDAVDRFESFLCRLGRRAAGA